MSALLPGSVELVVDVEVEGPARAGRTALRVRYCDACQRWGAEGSTHICGKNWSHRLSTLLKELGFTEPSRASLSLG